MVFSHRWFPIVLLFCVMVTLIGGAVVWSLVPCGRLPTNIQNLRQRIQTHWNATPTLTADDREILTQTLQTATQCWKYYTTLRHFFPVLDALIAQRLGTTSTHLATLNDTIPDFLGFAQTVINHYDTLTAPQKTYLVLLQNNMELRPTGGFMGSYALITFFDGTLTHFEIQDIYVPDGQLQGHVDPPAPIQSAFQQGFWKLRDANWHPDFSASARNVEWFFEQATGTHVDGIVAINFTTIETLAALLGPVPLPDYQRTITASTLYTFLQSTVEDHFFPGSTQKKDILNALATQYLLKLQHSTPDTLIQIVHHLATSLAHKEIQMSIPTLSASIDRHQWSGKVQPPNCGDTCFADFFSVVEANLGVNKANCCVQRSTAIQVEKKNASLERAVVMTYHNSSPSAEVSQHSGRYLAYVRVYVPKDTSVDTLTVDSLPYAAAIRVWKKEGELAPTTHEDIAVAQVNDMQEIGFWIRVNTAQTATVKLSVNTPINTQRQYTFFTFRQPGTQDFFNHFAFQWNTGPLQKQTITTDQAYFSTEFH